MTNPTTVKLSAWNTSRYTGPKELVDKEPVQLASHLLYRALDAEPSKDLPHWSRVGTADVTVHLDSADKMVDNMVVALRTQAKEVLAKAQAEATHLERKAQELLALPNNTGVAPEDFPKRTRKNTPPMPPVEFNDDDLPF